MPLCVDVENVTFFVESEPKSLKTLVYPAALLSHSTVGACWHPLSFHDIISTQSADDESLSPPASSKFITGSLSKIGQWTNGLHSFSGVMKAPDGI